VCKREGQRREDTKEGVSRDREELPAVYNQEEEVQVSIDIPE
jgi:hypothetical protein